jgi:hypothetical protein
MQQRYDEIVALCDKVAAKHLGAEYAELCRRMAAELARRRPSPLRHGQPRMWAAGIIYTVGKVNFLFDPSERPHMTAAELAAATGVGQSTMAAAFRKIMASLDLMPFDPEWTLPSKLPENPLAGMGTVNGIVVDFRDARPVIQQEAFERGIIPLVPPPGPRLLQMPALEPEDETEARPPAIASSMQDAMLEAESVLRKTLAEHPGATIDELNAALEAAIARQNRRPQAELGGLSPEQVHGLVMSDWHGPESAIRLDESIGLDELEPARTLHDARLILTMFAERGTVRATARGNLPRAFVHEFRDRMREPAVRREELPPEPRALNEADVFRLFLPRVLLEVAGLIKRRKGDFSRTRRGEQLSTGERAGELFSILVRTAFRRLDLEFMDWFGPAPAFQRHIGYTLYAFGRVGADWRKLEELADRLVLPGVRPLLPPNRYFDPAAFLLQSRFLRPLQQFGLAEKRASPGESDELGQHLEYRKSPLFDRVLSFRLAQGK